MTEQNEGVWDDDMSVRFPASLWKRIFQASSILGISSLTFCERAIRRYVLITLKQYRVIDENGNDVPL